MKEKKSNKNDKILHQTKQGLAKVVKEKKLVDKIAQNKLLLASAVIPVAVVGVVELDSAKAATLETYTLTANDVTITNGNITAVRSIEKMNGKKLIIPSEINGQTVKQFNATLNSGNHTIKEIELPDTIEVIGDEAFATYGKPSSIEKVMIGENSAEQEPMPLKHIGKEAFYNIKLSAHIEGLYYLWSSSTLNSLPKTKFLNIEDIGDNAFYDEFTTGDFISDFEFNSPNLKSFGTHIFNI